MPAARITRIRKAIDGARSSLGPEARRILENAKRNARTRAQLLEELEHYGGGAAVRLDPCIYLLTALEELTDIVEDHVEAG